MGLNLGLLGQVASRGLAGYQRGLISAESETYKRKREKEQQDRELAHQALMETLAQNADTRAAGDQTQQTEKYNYDLSQRPTTEKKTAAEIERINRENQPEAVKPDWVKEGFPDTPEGKVGYFRYLRSKSQAEFPERFKPPKVEDPAAERRKYISAHMSTRTNPRTQRDPMTGEVTMIPGDSPAAAYRALAEEYDLISAGTTPEEAKPQMRKGDWEPTDMNPGKSTAPPSEVPEAAQVAPSDTLSGQMPHDGGQTPLDPSDIARAATDPQFKDWLRGQGYHVP